MTITFTNKKMRNSIPLGMPLTIQALFRMGGLLAFDPRRAIFLNSERIRKTLLRRLLIIFSKLILLKLILILRFRAFGS